MRGPRCRAKAGNGGSGAGWGQGSRGPPRCPSLKEKRECVPGAPVDALWTWSAPLRMYVMKCTHMWDFERAEENSHVNRFPCFLPTCPGLSCATRLRGEHGCRPLIPNAWSCIRNLTVVCGPPSSKKLRGYPSEHSTRRMRGPACFWARGHPGGFEVGGSRRGTSEAPWSVPDRSVLRGDPGRGSGTPRRLQVGKIAELTQEA